MVALHVCLAQSMGITMISLCYRRVGWLLNSGSYFHCQKELYTSFMETLLICNPVYCWVAFNMHGQDSSGMVEHFDVKGERNCGVGVCWHYCAMAIPWFLIKYEKISVSSSKVLHHRCLFVQCINLLSWEPNLCLLWVRPFIISQIFWINWSITESRLASAFSYWINYLHEAEYDGSSLQYPSTWWWSYNMCIFLSLVQGQVAFCHHL